MGWEKDDKKYKLKEVVQNVKGIFPIRFDRCVALVRTDVSEEPSASFIRVTRICELGTTLAGTSNQHTMRRNTSVLRMLVAASVVPSSQILVTLMKEALGSSEMSVLTRATWR
jgi:hypothetical protein